jgi:hypothetical protein
MFPFLKQHYCDSFTLFIASAANVVLGLPLSSAGRIFADRFGVQAEYGGAPVVADVPTRAGFQPGPLLGPAP